MKLIDWLDIDIAYNESAVQHFNDYAMGNNSTHYANNWAYRLTLPITWLIMKTKEMVFTSVTSSGDTPVSSLENRNQGWSMEESTQRKHGQEEFKAGIIFNP